MERKELNGVVEVGVRWGKIVDQNANSNIIDLLIYMCLFVRLNILNIFVLLFLTYLFNLGNDKNKNR
jgi:hypothetical protein